MLSAIAYCLFPCSLRLDGLPFSSSIFGTWDPAWCAQAHKSGLLGLALHGCVGVTLGDFSWHRTGGGSCAFLAHEIPNRMLKHASL